MKRLPFLVLLYLAAFPAESQVCPLHRDCLDNPLTHGASIGTVGNKLHPSGASIGKRSVNSQIGEGVSVYDPSGKYRGRLTANPLNPESTSSRVGKYGSSISKDSLSHPSTSRSLPGRMAWPDNR
jgi:hypothetical protein